MRKKNQKQMPLMPCDIEHPRAKELDRISQILDSVPTITDMVLQDLTHGVKHRDRGAEGQSPEAEGPGPEARIGLPDRSDRPARPDGPEQDTQGAGGEGVEPDGD